MLLQIFLLHSSYILEKKRREVLTMYHMNSYPYSDYRPTREGTVTVQGEGIATAKPDVVVLTIGVMTEDNNVKAAQEENALRSNALLQALQTLGIQEKDIQTLSYTITPEYDYKDGVSSLRGYRVEHLYEVTVLNVQKAGEVYDAAIGAGANIARDLTFRVSDPGLYYEQALTRAVLNAQEKAKTVAEALQVNINPIPVSIVEEGGCAPQPLVGYAAAQPKAVTPIAPGELTVKVRVQGVFMYM
jgi:uncharacterized protein YggE